jgi:hypothetical protein
MIMNGGRSGFGRRSCPISGIHPRIRLERLRKDMKKQSGQPIIQWRFGTGTYKIQV